jgi:group I intron endonuclease
MTTGIYCIKNTSDNLCYIGQAVNIETRINTHKRKLRGNYHDNAYLQRSWNKYGAEQFEFIVLTECSIIDLNFMEDKFIKELSSLWPDGYNLRTGGDRDYVYTDEVKEKIGVGNKGKKKVSDKRKKELSDLWKTDKNPRKGKNFTDEERKEMSEKKKGQLPWNKGIPASDESKEKMRIAKKGKRQSQSLIDKRGASMQGTRIGKLGFRGIYKIKETSPNKFRAMITFKKEKYNLGGFPTAVLAAQAYDIKALSLYGNNAKLNFPELFEVYKEKLYQLENL